MADNWETLRIFISSTFKDMHAERDHLARVVFPELKELARGVRRHLIEVDLRWGVTEKEAQEGKALEICLDEIDTCRPYFIGLLGSRYGFVPDHQADSITAQEIYHGVLHAEIPRQIPDLRKILEGKLEGKSISKEQSSCLVRCYPWDPEKQKFVLRRGLNESEADIIRSIFRNYSLYQKDRSFFFSRTQRLTAELAGNNAADFFEQDQALQAKLNKLRTEIIQAKLPVFEYDSLETFGRTVLQTLWDRIRHEAAQSSAPAKKQMDEDAEAHDAFIAERTRRFVGRKEALVTLHRFTESRTPPVLIVHGNAGSGKSALMARFAQELNARHPDWFIITHFVGASVSSASLRQMLHRFCTILNRKSAAATNVPQDFRELVRLFPELLQKAAEHSNVVILIDAVNQLERNFRAHSMSWMPPLLRENVRFIISTLQGETLDALRARKDHPLELEITGLKEAEVRNLVENYLEEIRHKFPNTSVEKKFYEKTRHGNPLYITVALEELRIFGRFEGLPERVEQLPNTSIEIFEQVLQRVEQDFGKDLVRDCFSYLVAGRHGMTAEELQTLLRDYGPKGAEKLPDMIWARLYRSVGSYLFERSGVIDCFHNDFKSAIRSRYLPAPESAAEIHTKLGDYFEARWREPYLRSLNELPYQRSKGISKQSLERVLTDLKFIEAKCVAGMTFDLLEDYDRASDKFEDSAGAVQQFAEFLKNKSHILTRYPNLTFQEAANRPDDSAPALTSKELINSGDETRPWWRWINKNRPETPEVLTLSGHTSSVYACVFSPDGKRVASAGWDGIRIWDFQSGQQFDPDPVLRDRATGLCFTDAGLWIFTKAAQGMQADLLEEQTWRVMNHWLLPVTDVRCRSCISADNRFLAMVDRHEITIFNPITHAELKRLDLPKDAALCCGSFRQDGEFFAAAEISGDIYVWETQRWSQTLHRRSEAMDLRSCALSPDGRMIALTRPEGTLCEEISTGKTLAVLRGHSGAVESCCFSPTGDRLLTCSRDNSIIVWRPPRYDGKPVQVPAEFKDFTTKKSGFQSTKWSSTFFPSCGFSPDATFSILTDAAEGIFILNETGTDRLRKIISLYSDLAWQGHVPGTIALSTNLDLFAAGYNTGETVLFKLNQKEDEHSPRLEQPHEYKTTACCFSPDDSLLLTVSEDRTFHIYHVESRKLILIKQAHEGIVNGCSFLSGGALFVTVSDDSTIKVWKTKDGQLMETLSNDHPLLCCSVSKDDNRLLTGTSNGEIQIWNLDQKKLLRKYKARSNPVRWCWWSEDQTYVIAAHADGAILALDSNGGTTRAMFLTESDLLSASFAHRANRILLTTQDKSVYMLNLENMNASH